MEKFEVIVQQCTEKYSADFCMKQLDFLINAANISQFLPRMAWQDYRRLYRDVQVNRRKAAWDQLADDRQLRLADTGRIEDCMTSIKQEPGLIVTFHYGSFRLLPRMLVDRGFKVALLIAKGIRESQESQLLEQTVQLGSGGTLEFIDAEDPYCFKTMIRMQQDGFHILAYLDGNAGTQPEVDIDRSIRIPFLGSVLLLRKGLAALCYRMQWPVCIVCPCTVWNEAIDFYVENLLAPDACSIATYTKLFYSRAFAVLERAVRRDAGGWEGWLYPHALACERTVAVQDRPDNPVGAPYTDGKRFLMLDFRRYAWNYMSKRRWLRLNRKFKINYN